MPGILNETLKTGPDSVNKNGTEHGVKTTVFNNKRNTKKSNKVTVKAPLD